MAGKRVAPIRPGDFPLGSIESRLAMRTMIEAQREAWEHCRLDLMDLTVLTDAELKRLEILLTAAGVTEESEGSWELLADEQRAELETILAKCALPAG